jgi:hypothetical protein
MTRARLTSDLITRPRGPGQRRRKLVLTDESVRHWFRATLPPHVKRDLIPIPAEDLWRLTLADVRGFASVYVAATAAVLTFII